MKNPRINPALSRQRSRTDPTQTSRKADGTKVARTLRPRFECGIPLPRIDARKLGSRRFRALIKACVVEIGGDVSGLSDLDRLAISQAAALMLQIEDMQASLVAGEHVDADLIIRSGSECRRSLGVLAAKAEAAKAAKAEAERLRARNERLGL